MLTYWRTTQNIVTPPAAETPLLNRFETPRLSLYYAGLNSLGLGLRPRPQRRTAEAGRRRESKIRQLISIPKLLGRSKLKGERSERRGGTTRLEPQIQLEACAIYWMPGLVFPRSRRLIFTSGSFRPRSLKKTFKAWNRFYLPTKERAPAGFILSAIAVSSSLAAAVYDCSRPIIPADGPSKFPSVTGTRVNRHSPTPVWPVKRPLKKQPAAKQKAEQKSKTVCTSMSPIRENWPYSLSRDAAKWESTSSGCGRTWTFSRLPGSLSRRRSTRQLPRWRPKNATLSFMNIGLVRRLVLKRMEEAFRWVSTNSR